MIMVSAGLSQFSCFLLDYAGVSYRHAQDVRERRLWTRCGDRSRGTAWNTGSARPLQVLFQAPRLMVRDPEVPIHILSPEGLLDPAWRPPGPRVEDRRVQL